METKKETISIDDFAKVEIRIGTVLAAERVPETDKLIKCTVDFGLKQSASDADCSPNGSVGAKHEDGLDAAADGAEGEEGGAAANLARTEGAREIRTIVSGIAHLREPEALVGKQLPYITNLAPRKIKGILSDGMLLAVGADEHFALLHPDTDVPPGTSGK